MKKIILLFICLASALNINAEVYEGSCGDNGDNVRYSLDTSTGLLSITGTGAMTNYSSYSSVPWYSNNSYIKVVEISDGVTSIGDYAFRGCSGLTSITIPNSVTSIGNYAFYGCSGLTSVTIGNSVTSIGDYAFRGCSGLTSVTIGNSVTSIGSSAFYGTAWYNNQPEGLVYAGLVAYKYKGTMPENTSITIKEGTLGITGSAFLSCSGLTSITIPNSVTSIGNEAFWGCYFAKKDFINNSSLDAEANNYWGATIVDSRNDGFVIKDGTLLKYIGNDVSVTIPNSVTSIGNSAFEYCKGLTSVTIPNSVTNIGGGAFSGCSGLISIEIPNSVTFIGDYAFNYCSGLTSIEIPNSVTSIGSFAFNGCSGLTSVTIPNSVTSIGNGAFQYCSGLTSVTIGNRVTSIGNWAFFGCFGLTEVYCNAENIPTTSSNAFQNVNLTNATLIVPGSSVAAYKATSPWSGFGSIVALALRGDANGDGKVNMDDATFVTNIILGTEEAIEAADVNNDGTVNMPDVMFIINYIKNGKFPDE